MRRAFWMAWLMALTWSLVVATMAMLRPVSLVVDPCGGEPVEVGVEGAGDDAAVGLVGVERSRVAGPELQGCCGFPWVGEAVQGLELFDAAVGAEFGEQATAADALQLSRVTDEGHSPLVPVGERDDLVEGGGGQHAGLVDHQRGAGGQLELGQRWPVGPLVLVEELGDRVGCDAGVALDRSCCLCGGRHREHDPAMCAEVVGGRLEHAGLAGAGRSDDEDEPVAAGHRCCGGSLQGIETVAVDRRGGCGRVGLGGHRPREDRLLLGQDGLGCEPWGGGLDPHRTAVGLAHGGVAGRVEVDELVDDVVGGPFEGGGPAVTRLLGHGPLPVTDRLEDVGSSPRGVLLGHRVDDVGHDERVGRFEVRRGSRLVDAGVEQFGGPAGGVGLGPPPCRQIGVAVAGLA